MQTASWSRIKRTGIGIPLFTERSDRLRNQATTSYLKISVTRQPVLRLLESSSKRSLHHNLSTPTPLRHVRDTDITAESTRGRSPKPNTSARALPLPRLTVITNKQCGNLPRSPLRQTRDGPRLSIGRKTDHCQTDRNTSLHLLTFVEKLSRVSRHSDVLTLTSPRQKSEPTASASLSRCRMRPVEKPP